MFNSEVPMTQHDVLAVFDYTKFKNWIVQLPNNANVGWKNSCLYCPIAKYFAHCMPDMEDAFEIWIDAIYFERGDLAEQEIILPKWVETFNRLLVEDEMSFYEFANVNTCLNALDIINIYSL